MGSILGPMKGVIPTSDIDTPLWALLLKLLLADITKSRAGGRGGGSSPVFVPGCAISGFETPPFSAENLTLL